MTIRAVLFDFDDTLGDRETYAYNCYKALVLPYVESQDPYERESVMQDCMIYDQGGNTNKEYVRRALEKKYGFLLPYDDFVSVWNDNMWRYTVAFEDAEETLQYLQEKYMLGIITNGSSAGQKRKIEKSGLKKYFPEEYIIVSGDYDIAKPDSGLYLTACERMHVMPQECVFVGDTYGTDIIGAKRAGMTPVWIRHNSRRKYESDLIVIQSLKELKKLY